MILTQFFTYISLLQEHLHFVLDICDESGLYILDEEDPEPEDEDVETDILREVLNSLPSDAASLSSLQQVNRTYYF